MNDMKPSNSQQIKRPTVRKTGNTSKHTGPSNKTIEIRLHLPRLQHLRFIGTFVKRLRRTSRRQRLVLLIVLVITGTAVVIASQRLRQFNPAEATAITPSNPLDQLQKGTPDYPTLLPRGKSAEDLGGWTRISPPERDPVYAYVDTIASVPVSVSQQPLPATFKTDPGTKVRDLALAQNADKTLTAGSITLYIGTSKNGPQSVIFNTDALLVLIKSSALVPDEEWKKYVESLR
jgi:hypothetical protein